ncbi:hypothetical protein [Prevotella sp.]|uniref:hypothetical protein n=1 Tax=Prevotella sp. TaxID=59823 RepID=UPI0026762D79
MQIILTSDIIEFLNTLSDIDISNKYLPKAIVKIKDLSKVSNSKWGFLNYNSYILILKNGNGIPFTCPKEGVWKFISALKEDKVK